jgi:plastocyanin
MVRLLFALTILFFGQLPVWAAEPDYVDHNNMMDHGDGHLMDMQGGMVMGQNKDKLPGGCDRISEDAKITAHGGHKYSKDYPGTMFSFDMHEWSFKPCTRLTVTFINDDHIRHQWMMHGLPKYLYDKGMFHLEVTGPGSVSGTMILPAEDKTYLVHCDMAQHMEKGMKAQLVVGKGSAPFPSIPGLTDPAIPDDYSAGSVLTGNVAGTNAPSAAPPAPAAAQQRGAGEGEGSSWFSLSLVIGLVLGVAGSTFLAKKYAGVPTADAAADIFYRVVQGMQAFVRFVIGVLRKLLARIKYLPGK